MTCGDPTERSDPVGPPLVIHRPVPSRRRRSEPVRAVLPVVHTPYDYYRGFKDMMETDIAVGSGARRSRATATSSSRSSASFRAPLHARAPCRSCPVSCCSAPAGGLELAATDMELSLRTTLDGQGGGRRRGRRSRKAPPRPRAPPARDEVTLGTGSRRLAARHERALLVAAERIRGRGLPAPAGRRPAPHTIATASCSRRSSASRAPPRRTSRGRC